MQYCVIAIDLEINILGRGGIRTPDTIVRSHILYPTELHALYRYGSKTWGKCLCFILKLCGLRSPLEGGAYFLEVLERSRQAFLLVASNGGIHYVRGTRGASAHAVH